MVIFPKIWQLFGDFDYQASVYTDINPYGKSHYISLFRTLRSYLFSVIEQQFGNRDYTKFIF